MTPRRQYSLLRLPVLHKPGENIREHIQKNLSKYFAHATEPALFYGEVLCTSHNRKVSKEAVKYQSSDSSIQVVVDFSWHNEDKTQAAIHSLFRIDYYLWYYCADPIILQHPLIIQIVPGNQCHATLVDNQQALLSEQGVMSTEENNQPALLQGNKSTLFSPSATSEYVKDEKPRELFQDDSREEQELRIFLNELRLSYPSNIQYADLMSLEPGMMIFLNELCINYLSSIQYADLTRSLDKKMFRTEFSRLSEEAQKSVLGQQNEDSLKELSKFCSEAIKQNQKVNNPSIINILQAAINLITAEIASRKSPSAQVTIEPLPTGPVFKFK